MSARLRGAVFAGLLIGWACGRSAKTPDAGFADAGPADAGPVDAGQPDAGPPSCGGGPACDAGQLCAPQGCVPSPRVFVTTVPDLLNGTWHHWHSVPTAVAMIQSYPGLSVTVSPDPQMIAHLDPSQFDVIVFPAVGPWQFTDAGMAGLANFISSGRGFVGIHNAADTANFALGGGIDPVWYRDNLLGGLYWSGYPWLLDTLHRADTVHPSTTPPSMSWADSPAFEDELYAFQPLPANKLHLLLTVNVPPLFIDPVGDHYTDAGYVLPHPSTICRQSIGADGGRSWITALGHVSGLAGEPGNTYAIPWFQDHVYQGILWAAGVTSGNCPDDNPALVAP
jgi:type 1 glutamine amidotransferase